MQRQFLFSFVIPAYNAQLYLAEAIESVLAQSVDFAKNIQIVLVNDGSDDDTASICEGYRGRYPNNIVYIEKTHGGAGSARNAGIKAATGEYIAFLDADDQWEAGACKTALDFFGKHPKVNVACFPIVLFGTGKGGHWLNYKFGQTDRVANVLKNRDCSVLTPCACFFRAETVRTLLFDETLPVSEELLWIVKLLLEEGEFGLLALEGPCYHYRQHASQTSTLKTNRLFRYLEAPRLCHLEILRYARESRKKASPKLWLGGGFFTKGDRPQNHDEAPAWVQYAVMLDLTWRLREKDADFLTPAQKEVGRHLLKSCLERIDDRIICAVRGDFWAEERLRTLALKYGMTYEQVKEWVKPDAAAKTLSFCQPGSNPLPFIQPRYLRVRDIDGSKQLRLRGSYAVLLPHKRIRLVMTAEFPDGSVQEFPGSLIRCPELEKQYLFFEDDLWGLEYFDLALPFADFAAGTKVRAFAVIDDIPFDLTWAHEKNSPFAGGKAEPYRTRNGSVIAKLPDDKGIILEEIGSSVDFLFSFVIPCQDEEMRLAEAVESVLAQTLNFEDNIQIVLVNDGDSDGAAKVCEEYRKRYPANIVHVKQPASEVSAARNAGIEAAVGRYIGFLDAADQWEAGACEAALAFFDRHPWVHAACFPVMLFGLDGKVRPLNATPWTSTEVANIFKYPECAVFGPCSWFCRREAILDRRFAETFPVSEDVVWMAKLLLDVQDFGLIAESRYRKRERPEPDSALEPGRRDLSRCSDVPFLRHLEIFRYAEEKYGDVPQWAQSIVMSDLARRFREEDDGFLTPGQKEKYRGLMRNCLVRIDDQLIISTQELAMEERLCAIALKYAVSRAQLQEWIKPDEWTAALMLHIPEARPLRLCDMPAFQLDSMETAGGRLLLRGSFAVLVPCENGPIWLEMERPNGGKRSYPCVLSRRPDLNRLLFCEDDDPGIFDVFEASLPVADLAAGATIRAVATGDGMSFGLDWAYGQGVPLAQNDPKARWKRGGFVFGKLQDNKGIKVVNDGFLFSFIIPAYNVKPYVAEAVESVLAQTVNFKDNIQIILVNDGSTDGTGAVCKRYRDLYPDNIVYIEKTNGGVSSARNAGMLAATGRYINFLNADDKWDPGVCKAVLDFFKKNSKINIACFPIKFFDKSMDDHWINYKFKETKVANILKDKDYAVAGVMHCFFKLQSIKNASPFDANLSIDEDSKYIGKLLLDEQNFGIVSCPYYRCRKRFMQNAVLDISLSNLSTYFVTPRLYYLDILRYAETMYGTIPYWTQYAVMLDLTWRIKQQDDGFLTPVQKGRYRTLLRAILVQIDDKIISSVRNLWPEERLCTFALKYDKTYEEVKEWVKADDKSKSLHFCRPGAQSVPVGCPWSFRVEFMDTKNDCLLLRGSCSVLVPYERIGITLEVELSDGDTRQYPCELFRRPDRKKHCFFDENIWPLESYEVSLPLFDEARLRAFACIDGIRFDLTWRYEKLSPFVPDTKTAYLVRAGHIISQLPDGQGLCVESWSVRRVQDREQAFLDEVTQRSPGSTALVARIRRIARRIRSQSKKPIWLISDRVPFAGDNGEALFEYLMGTPEIRRDIRPIFVLGRDSDDWDRMKQIGPTIAHGSNLHYVLFLAADKYISSSINTPIRNPFGTDRWKYNDLINFDFVFLQHGVTLHDQSRGQNRASKNFALFITAAKREYQSILEGDYGYTSKQVVLTGFPRHDKLFRRAASESRQRLVTVMPTWRNNLAIGRNTNDDTPQIIPDFVQSRYFQFWNGMINHPRLLNALHEHDYCLRLAIHPYVASQVDKFEVQTPVEVVTHCNYSQTFCEAALLVTDYSSVAFDFALLKKPIIYAQFDIDTFYTSAQMHYKMGYYDFSADGFGPVYEDLDTTVDAVIRYLINDCEMEPMYKERVDVFFGSQPQNRCQTVVDAIRTLGKKQE